MQAWRGSELAWQWSGRVDMMGELVRVDLIGKLANDVHV